MVNPRYCGDSSRGGYASRVLTHSRVVVLIFFLLPIQIRLVPGTKSRGGCTNFYHMLLLFLLFGTNFQYNYGLIIQNHGDNEYPEENCVFSSRKKILFISMSKQQYVSDTLKLIEKHFM